MAVSLIDTDLLSLIKKKHLKANSDLIKHVQPASMDIPIGKVAYEVCQKFIPFTEKVQDIIKKVTVKKLNLAKGATLYKGKTYLIPCFEIDLPKHLEMRISPKSSIGRIDLLVRSIFDNTGLYDTVFAESKGTLWVEVTPQSFNVRLKTGIALNQLRIFDKNLYSPIDFEKTSFMYIKGKKITPMMYDNKLVSSLAVDQKIPFGYVAKETEEIVDMTKRNNPWNTFFEKISVEKKTTIKGTYTLEKGKFYILATKEAIRVDPEYSVEMLPSSHLIGELRVHYAGFFDPGFGQPKGNIGVLEIRPHEDVVVHDGQPICMYEIVRNKNIPKKLYGQAGNNYATQQGPKLAKFFTKP